MTSHVKVANPYITNYGVIYIEDLNISGMVKNHHLAKPINDASWSKFFELLSYKAEGADRKVVKVPRFEPTSKTCRECGAINQELTLADRQWFASLVVRHTIGITKPQSIFVGSGRPFRSKHMELVKAYLENALHFGV